MLISRAYQGEAFERENAQGQRDAAQKAQKQKTAARESAERRLVENYLQRGRSLCEQGEVARGLLWLAHGLAAIGEPGQEDLEHAIRLNIAAWRQHLYPLQLMVQQKDKVLFVACSPDGKTLLTASNDKSARLWNVATGEPIGPPLQHQGEVKSGAFSSDGKTVLTASNDKTVRLWDALTGESLGQPLEHQNAVFSAAFSPDGKTVVTGSSDGIVRLWNVATGKRVGRPMQHQERVNAVTFSPDGKTVLTGCNDGTARLWDAATGDPVGPPLANQSPVFGVAFSPDGKSLLTGCDDGTTRLRNVPEPVAGEHERITLWSQVITGMEIRANGATWDLDAKIWRERRRRLEELGGPPAIDSRVNARVQSKLQAAWAMHGEQWSLALFHLDHLIQADSGQWRHHLKRARVHAEMGDWQKAEADYAQALSLGAEDNPANRSELAQLSHQMAQAYHKLGLHEQETEALGKAIRHLQQLAADFPHMPGHQRELPLCYTELAVGLAAAGRTALAQAEFRKAEAAWHVRANEFRQEYDERRAAVKQNPTDLRALNNLAWFLATCPDPQSRQPKRAVELVEKAVDLNSQSGSTLNTLGVAQYRVGDYTAAIETLQKSKQRVSTSNNAFNFYFLAMAHWQLGHEDEARTWYDQAVESMQKHKPNDEGLRRFHAEAAVLLDFPVVAPKPNKEERNDSQSGEPGVSTPGFKNIDQPSVRPVG